MDSLIEAVQNFHGFPCRNAKTGQGFCCRKTVQYLPQGKGHHPDKGFGIQTGIVSNYKPAGFSAKDKSQSVAPFRRNLAVEGKAYGPSRFHAQNIPGLTSFPDISGPLCKHGSHIFYQFGRRPVRLPFLPQGLV